MSPDLVKVEDSLPRDGLLQQPLTIASLSAADPEPLADGRIRITFRVTIRDAEGRRCPDLAVEATVAGPERTANGSTTTDLLGSARFRMTGPAGTYRIRIDDVAAGAMTWEQEGNEAEITATPA